MSLSLSSSSPFVQQLLRSPTHHGPFPTYILQGIQSPNGANIQAIEQLDDFIHKFFVFNLPKNFFIQMAVAGGWISLLIIVGTIVILDRTRKKAFWVFKIQRRSEGIYIVPNALNSFLLIEGMFGIIWIAFVVVQYKGYWLQDDSVQYHIGVFNLIIWWPLWIGAFLAAWGSFYTAPGALDKGPLSSNRMGKFAPKPLIINIVCLGTPFILILSLIAPIVLTQRHFNSAFNAYRAFHQEIFESLASSPQQMLSPTLSQQYLEVASDIWEMQAKSAWYLSIGYGIWPIWAGLFLMFYIPAGGYLCYMVYKQLKRQKAILVDLELKRREMEAQERERQSKADEAIHRDQSEALLFQPLTSSQQQQQRQEDLERQAHHQDNEEGMGGRRDEEGHETDNSEGEIFFPALRPELKRRAIKRISVTGTPRNRYNYLRRCFINLCILYFGIVIAATIYLGIAAALAGSLYESYLSNPQAVTDVVYICCLVAAWVAVVFGSLTFYAIMARFADPANARDEEPKVKSTQPSRFLPFRTAPSSQGQSRTLTDEQQQQQQKQSQDQKKSRILPAMPESVGGTIDEQMQSNGTLSSFPTNKSGVDNLLRRDFARGINFSMQKKQGRLILKPSDTTSIGGQLDSVTGSYVDEISSRRAALNFPQDMTQGSIMEEEMEVLSRGSYQSANLIYHPTKHGDIPVPAPPAPKPLAPERSPPLSPVRVTEVTSQPEPIYQGSYRRRPSEWEIEKHHLPAPRRNSEISLRQYRNAMMGSSGRVEYPNPPSPPLIIRSEHMSLRQPQLLYLNSLSRRGSYTTPTTTSSTAADEDMRGGPFYPAHIGPVPPTPSTASTANFPITPVNLNKALPDVVELPDHDQHHHYLRLEPPPESKRRKDSLGPIHQPMGGLEASQLNQISPNRAFFSPGFHF